VSVLPHSAPEVAAEGSSSDFGRALTACGFPLIVWELPAGVARLANRATATLLGRPLSAVLGQKSTDLFAPRERTESAVVALNSGTVDGLQAKAQVLVGGELVPVWVWSRAVEVDGRRAAISLVIPVAEVGRLGRDPSAPWRDLAPVVVGGADREWHIERLSADIRNVTGGEPSESIGLSLLDLVHPDDARSVFGARSDTSTWTSSPGRVRIRHRNGTWVEVCLLAAPVGDPESGRIAFALVGPAVASHSADRVAELELRLRHIGTEVRAAGVLDDVDGLPAVSEYPQLGELTSRQWEILSRLLRGERVATIAAALYVNPSTVRNHLAAIFRRFGVHSQLELVDLLRRRP
jgi:DNA-binding CsgD family transcriptional regulator/PAS domain-containing protein